MIDIVVICKQPRGTWPELRSTSTSGRRASGEKGDLVNIPLATPTVMNEGAGWVPATLASSKDTGMGSLWRYDPVGAIEGGVDVLDPYLVGETEEAPGVLVLSTEGLRDDVSASAIGSISCQRTILAVYIYPFPGTQEDFEAMICEPSAPSQVTYKTDAVLGCIVSRSVIHPDMMNSGF
ncbi:hypothetical protein BD779DRAFT_1474692 [Infundibulicybe gibba]|nr:hypothetical protein BD779DRAFT_1474692 [Infundibulicybe gibba]